MTRVGKIARLPRNIRCLLNQRLQNGEIGTRMVEWLNSRPEVQTVLADEFGGRPISEQNLTEWKQGGYREWERHQEACERIRSVTSQGQDLEEAADESPLGDRLAPVLASELVRTAELMLAETTEPEERWQRLGELLKELARLRRDDHREGRLRIGQERWEKEADRLEEEERSREIQKAKDKATAPMRAAENLALMTARYGGGEAGRKIAAWMLELNFDLPPGSLTGKAESNQIKPNQTKSNQKKITPPPPEGSP